jgi:hypothetical protein
MKALVSVKLLLVVASFGAWSNPATAQNGSGPSQLPGKLGRKSR